ncbi:MAG TPA: divergent polysaccharide deacetylase family protein [Acetobacteraceae bacterium]|nr:divergent polysaccharide deacetylase family protein [Acetobacteraceae bacterium]
MPAPTPPGKVPRAAPGGGGWRALGRFWVVVIILLGGGAALLQWLGPPARPTPPPHVAAGAAPARQARIAATLPPRTAGPIAPPDPLLLEPAPGAPRAMLPRIGPDGATPMQVYARAFDAGDPRPRIGLVVAGIGESVEESEAAIALPGPVTLAFSPYTVDPSKLLAEARGKGHEILISLPLEPEGYPLNNPGDEALLVNAPPEQNLARLDWTLSRIEGYVGATGAMDGMYGERFAAVPSLLDGLERQLAGRGLLYIDPRAGQPDPAWVTGRTADLVVDVPPVGPAISANLGKLETIAQKRGSALGVVGWPGPTTIGIVASWAGTLGAKGLVLVPVTALVRPPTHQAETAPAPGAAESAGNP